MHRMFTDPMRSPSDPYLIECAFDDMLDQGRSFSETAFLEAIGYSKSDIPNYNFYITNIRARWDRFVGSSDKAQESYADKIERLLRTYG